MFTINWAIIINTIHNSKAVVRIRGNNSRTAHFIDKFGMQLRTKFTVSIFQVPLLWELDQRSSQFRTSSAKRIRESYSTTRQTTTSADWCQFESKTWASADSAIISVNYQILPWRHTIIWGNLCVYCHLTTWRNNLFKHSAEEIIALRVNRRLLDPFCYSFWHNFYSVAVAVHCLRLGRHMSTIM